MTIAELEALDSATITAETAASVIGASAQAIRIQARECPERLGFPVVCVGSRVKIPREPFVAFLRGSAETVASP